MQSFDVAILGGGPGGYVCAIRCAQYGLRTALIEADELGGTCLNRGCIPTKAMLHSAEVFREVCKATEYGVSTGEVSFDFNTIAKRRDKIVARLRGGIESLEKAYGVTLIRGHGILVGRNQIRVDKETIAAKNIVLATGSEPSRPPIPGIDGQNVLTSDCVLKLSDCPDSFVIVGGGVIGIEFASLFAAFGKPVTILEMLPEILAGIDHEIVQLLKKELKRQKIDIKTEVVVQRISGDSPVSVEYEEQGKVQSATGACCIVCTGRRPRTENLGLESLGLKLERGFVRVDDQMRTNIPGILAIGDITGKMQLAHVASAQGLVAAATCAGKTEKMSYDVIPSCVYTSPEVTQVGKTVKEAEAEGRQVRCASFRMNGNGKAIIMGCDSGMVKLVSDAETGEILGGTLMGPRATDLIAEIAAVMKSEGTIEELGATIHPHPTVSETIMEAAYAIEGRSCHQAPVLCAPNRLANGGH